MNLAHDAVPSHMVGRYPWMSLTLIIILLNRGDKGYESIVPCIGNPGDIPARIGVGVTSQCHSHLNVVGTHIQCRFSENTWIYKQRGAVSVKLLDYFSVLNGINKILSLLAYMGSNLLSPP